MSGHEIMVEYTNNDDGIWLFCSCGWKRNLGYYVKVEDVIVARDEHLATLPTAEELAKNGGVK